MGPPRLITNDAKHFRDRKQRDCYYLLTAITNAIIVTDEVLQRHLG